MIKSVYLPAMNATHIGAFKKKLTNKNNKEFLPLSKENSIYYHPNFLISAGASNNYKKKELSKELGYYEYLKDFNNIIIGDSGGHQIANGTIKYSDDIRKQIVDWLIDNSNYAMVLDLPPYSIPGKYKDFFTQSMKNFAYMNDRQKETDVKFINILHGKSEDDLNRWYDEVKDYDFTGGWAIGSTTIGVNIYYMLQSFFYSYDVGIFDNLTPEKILHFLGFSRNKDLIILLYLQKKLNQLGYKFRITFDSSSSTFSASKGNIFSFPKLTGMSHIRMSNKDIDVMKTLDIPMFCSCAACAGENLSDIFKNNFDTYAYAVLAQHNMITFFEFKEKVERLLDLMVHIPSMKESVLNGNQKIMFDIVDECFKEKGRSLKNLQKYEYVIKSMESVEERQVVNVSDLF